MVPGTGKVLRLFVGLAILLIGPVPVVVVADALVVVVVVVGGGRARREGLAGLAWKRRRGELRLIVESEERLFMVLGDPEGSPGLPRLLEGLSLVRTPVRAAVLGRESLETSGVMAGAEVEGGSPMPMFDKRLARTGTTEVEMQLVRGLPTGFVAVILPSVGFPPGKATTSGPDSRLAAVGRRSLLGTGACSLGAFGGAATGRPVFFSPWDTREGGGADISSENRSSFVTDRGSSWADNLIESIFFFSRAVTSSCTSPRSHKIRWSTLDIEYRLALGALAGFFMGSLGWLFFHSLSRSVGNGGR